MSYDYFYGQSGELFSYFRIPKALFQDHRFRQILSIYNGAGRTHNLPCKR